RLVYVCFIAICAVLALAAVAALRNISQATATADWVNHTHATIYELDRIVGSVVTGDGAARTFLWTGDHRELVVARGEFSELDDHLAAAKALTRDDAAVAAQVAALATLAEQQAAATLALVAAQSGKSRAEWETLLKSDPGGETLREIKRQAAKIRAGQFELLDQRDRAAYRQAHTTRWVVGTGVALDLLLLFAVAWLVRDDIATRRRLAETLQAANDVLETKVRERTRELVTANRQLSTENRERQWAAQSLEHQLRYHQLVVSATSDLVFVVTQPLTITRVNPAVSLRTGWPEEEILGRPLAEFVQEAGVAPDAPSAISLALRSGRELHAVPARLLDRRGSALAARFTLLPLRDNDKVVGGVVLLQLVFSSP
ncbi:MAG: CHASE3 domain-containing protein, partial [Pseudomonadota bacterium]